MNYEFSLSVLTGFYYAALGMIIGSFLNVCIYRIPLKLSVAKGHSFCPDCNHQLGAADLFPLFSFIFLKGRCRYCKAKISFRYPFVELLTGLCFFCSFWYYGFTAVSVILCMFFSVLIVLSFIDFDTHMVYDRFNLMILVFGIALFVSTYITGGKSYLDLSLLDRVIGLFAVSLPLLLIIYIYSALFKKEGMGGGDIKLLAVCGFFVGWKLILISFFFSAILGSIFGLIFIKSQGDSDDDDSDSDDSEESDDGIPAGGFAFVPCIAGGIFLAVLYGNELLSWYLSFLKV